MHKSKIFLQISFFFQFQTLFFRFLTLICEVHVPAFTCQQQRLNFLLKSLNFQNRSFKLEIPFNFPFSLVSISLKLLKFLIFKDDRIKFIH